MNLRFIGNGADQIAWPDPGLPPGSDIETRHTDIVAATTPSLSHRSPGLATMALAWLGPFGRPTRHGGNFLFLPLPALGAKHQFGRRRRDRRDITGVHHRIDHS